MTPDWRIAEEITKASGSNLWYVSRALAPEKRRFFNAAYASMRLVDDFVDNDFLRRSPQERASGRREALTRLNIWQQAAIQASEGTQGFADDREGRVFSCLAETLGHSDLGAGPWKALHQAMCHDVEEQEIADWPDYLAYCRGATVAPAEVFLYLLSCQVTPDGFEAANNLDCRVLARDMAVFCYLVHMMRDIRKDALADSQLVTIPTDMLANHGLTRDGLAASIGSADERGAVLGLLGDLDARAHEYRAGMKAAAEQVGARLATRERMILNSLLAIYCGLHDRISETPEELLTDGAREEAGLREKLAAKLGLGGLE